MALWDGWGDRLQTARREMPRQGDALFIALYFMNLKEVNYRFS